MALSNTVSNQTVILPSVAWATRRECNEFGVLPNTSSWAFVWIRQRLGTLLLSECDLVDIAQVQCDPLSIWYSRRVRSIVQVLSGFLPTGPKTRLLLPNLEQALALPNESADLIVSVSTIGHPSPVGRKRLMAECQRILRPGGLALITLSHFFGLDERAIATLAADPWMRAHDTLITPLNVPEMLSAAPQLHLSESADYSLLPGHKHFDERYLLGNPELLTRQLKNSDWATFSPETNALNLHWGELGMCLVKQGASDRRRAAAARQAELHDQGLSAVRQFLQSDRTEADAAVSRLRNGPELSPLLMHVHVPKCAGTSLNNLLRQNFGADFCDSYSTEYDSREDSWGGWGTVYDAQRLAKLIDRQPSIVCMASHSFRLFPRTVSGRVPLYVSFLRDPLQLFLSHQTYLKKNFANLTPEQRQHLPANLPEMSVRDLVQWLLAHEPMGENRRDTVRYYTNAVFLRQLSPLLHPDVVDSVRRDMDLELAIHLLEQFFFVGLVENISEGISLLARKLRPFGIQLPVEQVPTLNTSREGRGDLSWLTEDDAVGRIVLKWIEPDQRLYEYAKARFARELAQWPVEAF